MVVELITEVGLHRIEWLAVGRAVARTMMYGISHIACRVPSQVSIKRLPGDVGLLDMYSSTLHTPQGVFLMCQVVIGWSWGFWI